ncbi:hypothetical protein POM88_031626 [Heracleum sosnowskyi]|uniref:Uncharacterized protein n=1 Tax=Heracleum sosnowskyi TaxID=360622 RepID=A0AAD8HZW3_9APIA|nr:hypothetical protein POM88_031626 [Heracleum sosnowskyi]
MTVLVWLFIFSTVALSQPLLPPGPGFKPPPVLVCHCPPASPPHVENISVGKFTKGELTPESFSEIMTSVAFAIMLLNTWALFMIYEHLLPPVRSSLPGGNEDLTGGNRCS